MPGVLVASLDSLAGHPLLAGLAVFLISAAESLVGVGLFIPGTFVMFGIGSLVAFGALNLWGTIAWAAAGAVVGDGLSFWIGRRYRDNLRGWWPFSRHPEWLERSEVFFRRHGGKSVLFGRFAGPVGPLVPAVAGMLGMPPASTWSTSSRRSLGLRRTSCPERCSAHRSKSPLPWRPGSWSSWAV